MNNSRSDLAIRAQASVVEEAYLVAVAQDEDADQDADSTTQRLAEGPQVHLDRLAGGHHHHSSFVVACRPVSQGRGQGLNSAAVMAERAKARRGCMSERLIGMVGMVVDPVVAAARGDVVGRGG